MRSKNVFTVPKDDIDDITVALTAKVPAQAITKNPSGKRIASGHTMSEPVAIKSYAGRRLKHNKMVFELGFGTTLVAEKGELFDNIPLEKKRKVVWMDSDFEP